MSGRPFATDVGIEVRQGLTLGDTVFVIALEFAISLVVWDAQVRWFVDEWRVDFEDDRWFTRCYYDGRWHA